eukprot:37473-Eustigmatos_ZCMA.PRE.1
MIQRLLDMTWVPVLKTRPVPYLPWSEEREKASPGVDGSLADPKSARSVPHIRESLMDSRLQ